MAIAREFDKIPPTISAVINRRHSIEANISLLRALQKECERYFVNPTHVQSVFSTPLYQNFAIVKLLLKSDEPEEPNFCDFSCISITTHAL